MILLQNGKIKIKIKLYQTEKIKKWKIFVMG
jgi:hypothetical protein